MTDSSEKATLTSKAKGDGVKKADAHCWHAFWAGKTKGWVAVPGNWIKYDDYLVLWDAYQELRRAIREHGDEIVRLSAKENAPETYERRLAEACERMRRAAALVAMAGDQSMALAIYDHSRRLLGDVPPWWDSENTPKASEHLDPLCNCPVDSWGVVKCLEDSGIVRCRAEVNAENAAPMCDDCPPVGYPTDKTRCDECPRRSQGKGE